MGRTLARQSSQTGKREILFSGVPQRRQSAGKRVANRLSAASVRHDRTTASTLEMPAANRVRSRSLLLLKTTSATAAPSAGASRKHLSQYSHGPEMAQSATCVTLVQGQALSTGYGTNLGVLGACWAYL